MDQEIENYLKIALDTSVSSYYRKDAIRHLGRVRKSAELSHAILKVLNDVDDPSLQREAMDLAAQFTVTESVNFLLPIATGKGSNGRYAINVLAKIGGVQSYKCLKSIAASPGFDLSKTAAKRAIEDLLRREPDIEKEAGTSSLVGGAQDIYNGISEKVTNAVSDVTQALKKEEPVKPAQASTDTGAQKREITTLLNKVNSLERKLSEKNAQVEALEEKMRQLKKSDKVSAELKDVKRTLHESRNETASVKATFEKQLALMKGKLISLEEENDDLLKRHSRKMAGSQKSKAGCIPVIVFFGIFFFVAWFIFSSVFSDTPVMEQIPEEIKKQILK